MKSLTLKVTIALILLAAGGVVLFIYWPRPEQEPRPQFFVGTIPPEMLRQKSMPPVIPGGDIPTSIPLGTNRARFSADGSFMFSPFVGMTALESNAMRQVFERKMKPALTNWAQAYAGHVPFDLGELKPEHFLGQTGRGNRCTYDFRFGDVRISFQNFDSAVRVFAMHTTDNMKLMQVPQGTPPDLNVPVTKQDVSQMVKQDLGIEFSPAEILIYPSGAFSGARGGAMVTVGGDPNNGASWKCTLVFGPDGKLTYYQKDAFIK